MGIYRVKIKGDYIKELKSSDDFILAVQLSRIVNALRSSLRSYINVSNNDRWLDIKDRMDLLLIHGSMLYEAIHEFSRMSKRLSQLNYWKNNTEQQLHGSYNGPRTSRLRNMGGLICPKCGYDTRGPRCKYGYYLKETYGHFGQRVNRGKRCLHYWFYFWHAGKRWDKCKDCKFRGDW